MLLAMRRTGALLALAALACTGGGKPRALAAPNVLFLVIDCLRADHLSATGYPRPTTPNLDALAREGVTFTHAFAQATWTRPSVPTLLSGLYPSEHALQEFYRGEGGAVMSPRLSDRVTTLAEAVKAHGYRTGLVGEQAQLSRRFGLDQGFDFYQSHVGAARNIHSVLFDWLDSSRQPFFAYLHYLEVHWPYCPPAEVRGTFDTFNSPLPVCRDWRGLRKKLETREIVPTPVDIEAFKARYDEELMALDRELGLAFAELKAKGLWDNTLIVVTADHGEQFYEHGAGEHGKYLWDELLRVPLLFKLPASWPGERGARLDTIVETRSIVPTVLEAIGAPAIPEVSAKSLVPWLIDRAPAGPPQPFVVAEIGSQVAVRDERWKMIADRDGKAFQLYDLQSDPGETRDVADTDRRELARLRADLDLWSRGLAKADASQQGEVDRKTVEDLKALGYLNDND
jgi:arylsulfatase A-like enzyme